VGRPGTGGYEARKVRPRRGSVWVAERVRVARSRRRQGHLVACEDVTERKRAEDMLRESEERFRSAFVRGGDRNGPVSSRPLAGGQRCGACELLGYLEG